MYTVVDCGKPGPFFNGYIDGQQTTFGSSVIYRWALFYMIISCENNIICDTRIFCLRLIIIILNIRLLRSCQKASAIYACIMFCIVSYLLNWYRKIWTTISTWYDIVPWEMSFNRCISPWNIFNLIQIINLSHTWLRVSIGLTSKIVFEFTRVYSLFIRTLNFPTYLYLITLSPWPLSAVNETNALLHCFTNKHF